MKKISEYLDLNSEHFSYIENCNLSEHSSFRIGGPVKLAVFPRSIEALVDIAKRLSGSGIKYEVIGRGSNILFYDSGYDGTLVFTKKICGIERVGECMLKAYCGTPLGELSAAARDASLTGLEFAYGIPGSVGGAVYMNAGAYDGDMGSVVVETGYYDRDRREIITIKGEEHGFSYRKSCFNSMNGIVLYTVVKLSHGDKGAIAEKMQRYMTARIEKQPLEYPSAGSVFKRYEGKYTAKMIDESGLKGFSIGGAQVSEKHAGFIINRGGATAADVKALVEHVKEVIKKNYSVELECEIRFM